jgi:hypothetical protein
VDNNRSGTTALVERINAVADAEGFDTLCEGTNSARMHDAEYRAYYQRKHDEVRLHQHKRSIVLIARKLVWLVVRLLTTH